MYLCGSPHREQEYTQTRAELVKETEQMRVESQKVRGRLDTCQRELGEAKKRLKKKESEVESSVSSMRRELATRAQQVVPSPPSPLPGLTQPSLLPVVSLSFPSAAGAGDGSAATHSPDRVLVSPAGVGTESGTASV